jgi:hypothetical protein
MAQISKGDTFTDGQQVTGARLNQLVDASVLLVGAITDQPSITANTLEATDTTIVNDAGVLKEATIGDFLNSNLPITTSSITGGTGVDIAVAPAAGQKFDVNGAFEATTSNTTSNSTIGGTLVVTGGTTLTGNVIADNGFTSNGVANFTGALQVNGTVGYVLTEIVEETVSAYSTTSTANTYTVMFTSASYTKPSDEIWCVEIVGSYSYNIQGYLSYKLKRTSGSVDLCGSFDLDQNTTAVNVTHYLHLSATENTGTAFTSTYTFEMGYNISGYFIGVGQTTSVGAGTNTVPSTKFRIYKYKTA